MSAQSVISTAETLFEGFAGNNYYFLNLTELFDWMRKMLKDFDGRLDDFIQLRSFNDTLDRLLERILDKQEDDEKILSAFLDSLTDEELTLLYYKNNLIEFISDHDEIQSLIITIFDSVENLEYVDKDDKDWYKYIPKKYDDKFRGKSVEDWNKFVDKQYFMDPNDVPDSIAGYLGILKDHLMKYVYCRYLSVDRIYRLKNFKRKVVTVIDTDSNILSLDTSIEYILDEVIRGDSFGRSELNNVFICVNMLAYVLTEVVTDILLTYGEKSNIPEEFRPIYNMKNEFLNKLKMGTINLSNCWKLLLGYQYQSVTI